MIFPLFEGNEVVLVVLLFKLLPLSLSTYAGLAGFRLMKLSVFIVVLEAVLIFHLFKVILTNFVKVIIAFLSDKKQAINKKSTPKSALMSLNFD